MLLYFSEMKSPRHYYEVIAEGKRPSSLLFFPTFPNITYVRKFGDEAICPMRMLGLQCLLAKLSSHSCLR